MEGLSLEWVNVVDQMVDRTFCSLFGTWFLNLQWMVFKEIVSEVKFSFFIILPKFNLIYFFYEFLIFTWSQKYN